MPVYYDCNACEDVAESSEAAIAHQAVRHNDYAGEPSSPRNNWTVRYVSQANAQGVEHLRRFACQRCARMVETRDGSRATDPRCDECREA